MGDRDKLGDRDRRVRVAADGELYTVGDAARYLLVSETTIRNWERLGRLRCVHTAGGMRIFERGELDRVKREAADARGK